MFYALRGREAETFLCAEAGSFLSCHAYFIEACSFSGQDPSDWSAQRETCTYRHFAWLRNTQKHHSIWLKNTLFRFQAHVLAARLWVNVHKCFVLADLCCNFSQFYSAAERSSRTLRLGSVVVQRSGSSSRLQLSVQGWRHVTLGWVNKHSLHMRA